MPDTDERFAVSDFVLPKRALRNWQCQGKRYRIRLSPLLAALRQGRCGGSDIAETSMTGLVPGSISFVDEFLRAGVHFFGV